jgi:predicted O-methyltransferase YrrM
MSSRIRKSIFILEYAVGLVASLYLFSVGWLNQRNRHLIQQIGGHFGFRPREVRPLLPKISISEVLPGRLDQRVQEPVSQDGNVTLLELCVLNELVKRHRPKTIFEMGTFDGRTTLNLALNSAPDAQIWTLDLPAGELGKTRHALAGTEVEYVRKTSSGIRFQGHPEADRIKQLYGDTAQFDFSPFLSQIDFVFIDASHAYDYVVNDTRVALKLLRNRQGVIVWHDYGAWPGVTTALNEFFVSSQIPELRHVDGTTLVAAIFTSGSGVQRELL